MKHRFGYSLVVLSICFSLSSEAAIVSDNDGAAFVTKAEFDALKNSFSKQISDYNDSIDGKIDGAIAQYLAGLSISKSGENLWVKVDQATGGGMLWRNKMIGYGEPAINVKVNIDAKREVYVNEYKGFYSRFNYFIYGKNTSSGSPAFQGRYYNSQGTFVGLCGAANGGIPKGQVHDNSSYGQNMGQFSQYNVFTDGLTDRSKWASSSTGYNTYTSVVSSCDGDSGKIWEIEKNPAGYYTLSKYYNSYALMQNISVIRHQYQDWTWQSGMSSSAFTTVFGTVYLTSTGRSVGDTAGGYPFDITASNKYGTLTGGTDDPTAKGDGYYWEQTISRELGTYPRNYSLDQWSADLDTDLSTIVADSNVDYDSTKTTKTMSGFSFLGSYGSVSGSTVQNNTLGDVLVKYNQVKQDVNTLDPKTLCNSFCTSVAGEKVYLGGGAPFFRTFPEASSNIKCKILFVVYSDDGVTVAPSQDVSFKISNKQFYNGDFDTGKGGRNLGEWTVPSDTEYEFVLDCVENSLYWITCSAVTPGYNVKIKVLECKQ